MILGSNVLGMIYNLIVRLRKPSKYQKVQNGAIVSVLKFGSLSTLHKKELKDISSVREGFEFLRTLHVKIADSVK